MTNQREEASRQREHTRNLYRSTASEDEKEIYKIMMKLNELEEINENIEKCLQDNQFL